MIKAAIVGCGKIADAHVEEIQKLDHARVVAVCDIVPLMAEQLACRYGVEGWYQNLSTMLQAVHPDVVHITTPPQFHLEIVRQAVAAGSHVYVEKPLALDAEQTRQLIESVTQAGKKLTVNFWCNFDPPGLQLNELVRQGVLGTPVHVESHLGYDLNGTFGKALLADPNHWIHRLPGKLFQNNLDHILNKIVPFLPDVPPEVSVLAFRTGKELHHDVRDELLDELRVTIRAENVTAYATFTSHAQPPLHLLRVYGSKKTVTVDYNLRVVTFAEELQPPSALGRLLPPFRLARQNLRQALQNVGRFRRSQAHYFAGMNQLIRRFYDSVENDAPLPISYRDMLRVANLMDAIVAGAYPAVKR